MAEKKKRWKKPIMIPEAEQRMMEMRYEIAKKMNMTQEGDENWWDKLSNMQKSQVNGIVTKLLIGKAQMDIMSKNFNTK